MRSFALGAVVLCGILAGAGASRDVCAMEGAPLCKTQQLAATCSPGVVWLTRKRSKTLKRNRCCQYRQVCSKWVCWWTVEKCGAEVCVQ